MLKNKNFWLVLVLTLGIAIYAYAQQPVAQSGAPWSVNWSAQTVTVTQATGTNLHTVVDTLPALAAGTNTVGSIKVTDGTNTEVVDPCRGQTKVFFNISQTTNTRLVIGTASKKFYLCHLFIAPLAAAANVALVEGTGTACATNTIAFPGATGGSGTAATGANLAANSGFVLGDGSAAVGQSSVTADDTCLYNSGSGQISGGGDGVVQ